jgi:hypothetical protein
VNERLPAELVHANLFKLASDGLKLFMCARKAVRKVELIDATAKKVDAHAQYSSMLDGSHQNRTDSDSA